MSGTPTRARVSEGTTSCLCLGAFVIACLPLQTHAVDPSQADVPGIVSGTEIEQALQKPKSRGLALRAKEEPAVESATQATQSIDLNIPFEFNSITLRPEATAQLKQLEAALASQSLSRDRFLVAGHTDATGRSQYNQKLSLRRAEAVKRFLVGDGVAADRLEAQGFGAGQLLAPDRPGDPLNRRVEIRNLGEKFP